MKNDIEDIIRSELRSSRRVSSEKLSKLAGISRQAAHKKLSALVKKNMLRKTGSTRGAYYTESGYLQRKALVSLRLRNKGLREHVVLENIGRTTSVLAGMSKKAQGIFDYAFTEMLNNAIEHSRSKWIYVNVYPEGKMICFEVIDQGIGVYNNLKKKFNVRTELSAIQELLKGKRTTAPRYHSGEGIFFTEKASDVFELEGGRTKLIVDNKEDDIAVKEFSPARKGTKVSFKLSKGSKKSLNAIFNEYTDEEYRFSKTKVLVKLYEQGVNYVSRSQARRLLFGLDKFKTVVLDFNKIKGIGQGFADEIFRVYAKDHPDIKVFPKNASKTVMFMIERAIAAK